MKVYFTQEAREEYSEWGQANKQVAARIRKLIKDIQENGFLVGIGKPEQLRYFKDPLRFSRRITKSDRLVYSPSGHNDMLIISCKGHYDDK